jgi:DNA polymerase-3 subunit epsilon
VLEVRLIHHHQPPFNRRSKVWRRYVYLKLTLDERFPRLSVVRAPKSGDGCLYLGPLPSSATARQVAEAIESVVPLRRCTARVGKVSRASPCAPAQLGVATCPCAGQIGQPEYAAIVERVVRAITIDPSPVLDPLVARMRALAQAERFEEAADTRDRAAALVRALTRQRRFDGLRRSGRLVVEGQGGERVVLGGGRLLAGAAPVLDLDDDPRGPLPRELADELACVAAWLDAEAPRVRLVACDGELCSPLPKLPCFEPKR